MNQIKLEVGKKYRNRRGDVVEITMQVGERFDAKSSSYRHTATGRVHIDSSAESPYDLIEEVIDGPVKKPHKHAELIKVWADGAEIEVKDGDNWVDLCQRPRWNEDSEYRIKPPEVPQWRKDMARAIEDGNVVEFRFGRGWDVACIKKELLLDPHQSMYEGNYRIEPEPKPDVVEFYVKFPNDELRLHGADFEWVSENGKKYPQLKVIWDSEGNLKGAEVLK